MAKKKKIGSTNPKYNAAVDSVLKPAKEVVSYATIRTSVNVETNKKAKVTAVWY